MIFRKLKKLPRFVLPPSPPPPYAVSASIIAFRRFILAESEMKYRSSHHDPKGLALTLPPGADDAQLGQVAWAVLRAARFITPDDPDWPLMELTWDQAKGQREERHQRLLAQAGIKTLRALYEGARLVGLKRSDGHIEILPWARDGYDGWTGIPGKKGDTYPDTLTEEELGRAVRKALARAVG